ncbi:MAG: FixH family protein [Gammaproteobacteria bacterium]|nr:FixH family protein [Gammaproteobacteria bacterium]
MIPSMRFSASLCVCLLLAPAGLAGDALPVPEPVTARATDLGRYRIAYASALEPLAINRIHAWVVHVADADGQPVDGAELAVSGGMPAHDHGLPTAPRMTRNLGGGNYLVEGMRFHMGGDWEVTLAVVGPDGMDSLTLQLNL